MRRGTFRDLVLVPPARVGVGPCTALRTALCHQPGPGRHQAVARDDESANKTRIITPAW